MGNPKMSFHVHQILSALKDISNHILYLPDSYRDTISTELAALSKSCTEMISEHDLQSGSQSFAEEYDASDKTQDVAPFVRTETIELFDNYIALNADGVFTYANPTAFTIFGRPESDLLGKNIWEALPELKESSLYPAFQEAVETRMPAHVEMQGIDSRWFAINIHPTRQGVIIYWEDVTEKKQIEQALLASEERLRAAIETAPINVFTLNRDLRYVWIGKRWDGFFHEPVLGKRDDELLPAQDAAVLMEAEQYVLDTGKGLRKEVSFQKNKQRVIYHMAIEPLFDDVSGVVGLTIAVMDVTEQRRLEAERREYAAQMEIQRRLIGQSEMERSELSRNLHDGPIQSLVNLGFSLQIIKEILQEERVGKAEGDLQKMGDEIKGAIVELRSVCNDLRPPELSRLGVCRAIQENIKEFHQKHSSIRITTDFSDDTNLLPDPIALAFYRIYQQALNNIVRHAEASEAAVRLMIEAQQVCFEIQDNGKGLSKPLDWVAYAREGHLGIVGMKERAEAIGGTFQLISQPGEGTMVQVIVPLAE